MSSRVSNPSETSALSPRLKTAKPNGAKSISYYDQIHIHSEKDLGENDDPAKRKRIVVETLTNKANFKTINVASSFFN